MEPILLVAIHLYFPPSSCFADIILYERSVDNVVIGIPSFSHLNCGDGLPVTKRIRVSLFIVNCKNSKILLCYIFGSFLLRGVYCYYVAYVLNLLKK